jgi:hypothetical protein
MGKIKELFMKQNYPEYDLDREYLIDDVLAQEQRYFESQKLKSDPDMNSPLNTKIEVQHGTKIEVSSKEYADNREVEVA